jgi:hypothetical protein
MEQSLGIPAKDGLRRGANGQFRLEWLNAKRTMREDPHVVPRLVHFLHREGAIIAQAFFHCRRTARGARLEQTMERVIPIMFFKGNDEWFCNIARHRCDLATPHDF